jgi:hypothetical protein
MSALFSWPASVRSQSNKQGIRQNKPAPRLVLLILLLALVFPLYACAASPAGNRPASDEASLTTIGLAVDLDLMDVDLILAEVEAFRNSNPNIAVLVSPYSPNQATTLDDAVALLLDQSADALVIPDLTAEMQDTGPGPDRLRQAVQGNIPLVAVEPACDVDRTIIHSALEQAAALLQEPAELKVSGSARE